MRKVYALIVVISIMAIWSVGSIYLLVHLTNDVLETKRELQSARRLLFEYQVQYDRVFERAYHSSENLTQRLKDASQASSSPLASEASSQKTSQTAVAEDLNIEIDGKKNQNKGNPTQPARSNDPQPPKTLSESMAPQNPAMVSGHKKNDLKSSEPSLEKILIHNQSIIKQGPLISVSLDMTNSAQNAESKEAKIEGYLWVTLEYTFKNAEKIQIYSPESVEIDPSTKNPKNRKASSSFAIKRFKRKTFQFRLPRDEPGELTKLTLGMIDKLGINSREVPLIINLENHVQENLNL